ncbi:hypothetical protein GCM10009560_13040 [Nonomuraea longicatena]|uniref:Uncharacterized protein n=1 Tax=Nonomuraea longicatena TaxID=83682 RepID=A0ABN1NVP6_9ACTN
MSNSNPRPTVPERPCHPPSALLGFTCLQLLATGWITSTGPCPGCTAMLMDGPVHAAPESLVWSVFHSGELVKAAQWQS